MITIYSTPTCPKCAMAMSYLTKNNIAFKKIDLTEDADAMAFVKSEGHKTVPQIYYEDRILVEGGYDGLRALSPEELTKRIQQYDNGKDEF